MAIKLEGMKESELLILDVGDVVWLKGATDEQIRAALDVLAKVGLDLMFVGPRDRYKVVPAFEGPPHLVQL